MHIFWKDLDFDLVSLHINRSLKETYVPKVRMDFRLGGGGPDLKHLWVLYDFNKVQLSGRGRKNCL